MRPRTYTVGDDGRIYCDRSGCPGSAGLRDYRTNVPICQKCAVKTPVGYVSKDTARAQQRTFFNASPVDYAIAGGLAWFLAFVAGFFLIGLLGWWLLVAVLSFPVGGMIGEAIWRVLRGKRGMYMAQAVAVGIVLAAIPLFFVTFNLFGVLVFTFITIGSASARFQIGLRV
ncbi:MAG: hypothetical protein HC915_15995 [Anaerolineae bacterium]|nr:hypothetical protein [Anaerolineae bacterium]